jgi:UDP-glucose 4-epimerase
MRTIVTGVAGFIGSHVAEHLLAGGHEVVGLDDLSGGFADNVPDGVEFHQGSALDDELVRRLFAGRRIDAVFHLAAYAAEGLSHFIRRFNYANNVLGSMNLLNAAVNAGAGTFVFTSSIAVYGHAPEAKTEADQPRPEDPYGVAKFAVELDLEAAHRMFGIDYVVFRPHNVYGERQHLGDRYRNVIGIFMNQAMRGEPMTIFGDGTQTRAFSYIGDVAPAIARSIDVPAARNQVFNIGADEPTSVNALASLVAAAMGVAPRVVHLPARQEAWHAMADHGKVAQVFGSRAAVRLPEGLRRMAEWARRVGPREPSRRSDIEVPKNLPPSWN